MKCDRCHVNEASVHIAQIVNGQKREQHLCQSCAQEGGMDSTFEGLFNPLLSSGFFGGSIFNPTGGIPAFGGASASPNHEMVCPNCGTTFEAFRKSGLFGCSQCYETFREKLDPVLRRVQGGTRHIGRQVCKTEESKEQMVLRTKLNDLRQSLAAAVEREAYEEAARLRDEVHALEARICDIAGPNPGGVTSSGGATGPDDGEPGKGRGGPGRKGSEPDSGKGKGASR